MVPLTSLLQVTLLLLAGQLILGAPAYAVGGPGGVPWLSLPLLVLFLWLIARTGAVLRQEMAAAVKRRQAVVPWRMVVAAILLWQAPALLGLALSKWLPGWVTLAWHGAMLSAVGTLDLIFPAMNLADTAWWPYVASLLEVALFAVVAGRPVLPAAVSHQPAVQARAAVAAGEWAPARRHKDVVKKKGPIRQEQE